jgi:eukaryotic-like serine/threonine-protein kinase
VPAHDRASEIDRRRRGAPEQRVPFLTLGGWLVVVLVAAVAYRLGWRAGARRAAGQIASGPRAVASASATHTPGSTPPAGATLPPNDADDGPTLRPDRATLGRYRLERQLGRGSMGAVYLGYDPQIGRAVALKTMALSREFEGQELADVRARFFREAEMAGRLHHPDIVAIFDAGEEDGLAYIAMEYVNGHDLLRHTRPGRLLPVPMVLELLARVALALAYAHTQGVVHRDIKPANVMIDLESGAIKVTDFGVASVTNSCRTRTGLVLGTPSFMSPEQMAGRRVDGRTDLYSLGVMMFQLLTGALPHASDSMADLMFKIANEPAPDVRTLRPELPEELANVVALALEKRSEVRYADGGQMASDLRAVAALMAAAQAAPDVTNDPESGRFVADPR